MGADGSTKMYVQCMYINTYNYIHIFVCSKCFLNELSFIQ